MTQAPRVLPFSALSVHAQEGYGTCLCLCVSVCYHSIGNIRHFYAENEVRMGFVLGFSGFLIFDKSFCSEVMAKANMQMSIYAP